ncbi:hypothetical protein [Nonomuraea gerenzanensis]|uniref:Uncharacterized protein n=1 Tax=Nonomuraea gerenzanensis TaxID=93944 RepID=A0A1M4E8K0_9ACTN|nr:hypothetical protein [Nonomuraea gerenzanensis]UBU17394.1 hypothetical protein LCN96_20920 [Nonomuraea gerenzanensis]SBO95146.1 hypothetical protein BN4615_P4662 [Nonomuraea gerenzanensis]
MKRRPEAEAARADTDADLRYDKSLSPYFDGEPAAVYDAVARVWSGAALPRVTGSPRKERTTTGSPGSGFAFTERAAAESPGQWLRHELDEPPPKAPAVAPLVYRDDLRRRIGERDSAFHPISPEC